MKKIILIFCILISATIVSAQKLIKLTATGFVSVADTTKDYIVVDVPGTTAEELYDRLRAKILQEAVSAKHFLNEDKKSFTLTFNSNLEFTGMGSNNRLIYNVVISCKDNKIKIQPNFLRLYIEMIEMPLTGGTMLAPALFNKKGEIKWRKIYDPLSSSFDAMIEHIIGWADEHGSEDW